MQVADTVPCRSGDRSTYSSRRISKSRASTSIRSSSSAILAEEAIILAPILVPKLCVGTGGSSALRTRDSLAAERLCVRSHAERGYEPVWNDCVLASPSPCDSVGNASFCVAADDITTGRQVLDVAKPPFASVVDVDKRPGDSGMFSNIRYRLFPRTIVLENPGEHRPNSLKKLILDLPLVPSYRYVKTWQHASEWLCIIHAPAG